MKLKLNLKRTNLYEELVLYFNNEKNNTTKSNKKEM